MFKTNEYFEGKVVSIAFTSEKGPATAGVMAGGEYEFGTSTKEYMTVTSGAMTVKLPGAAEWIGRDRLLLRPGGKEIAYRRVGECECGYIMIERDRPERGRCVQKTGRGSPPRPVGRTPLEAPCRSCRGGRGRESQRDLDRPRRL